MQLICTPSLVRPDRLFYAHMPASALEVTHRPCSLYMSLWLRQMKQGRSDAQRCSAGQYLNIVQGSYLLSLAARPQSWSLKITGAVWDAAMNDAKTPTTMACGDYMNLLQRKAPFETQRLRLVRSHDVHPDAGSCKRFCIILQNAGDCMKQPCPSFSWQTVKSG